ncbi:Rossmann-like and DUF2520 domain-containing protein [Legionella pneumophila]|uniref:Uncharacterized conserved protein n=1 Tax=Legionella pneumophila subsp. pascullei TaxID=91890 RepID=A0AAX2J1B4_LEGPN|nr:Rossmann-like and DUF2520 domain-containing protein [Legionella pneumophila]AMP90910.1 hypothetical protein AXF35_14920 [Legionella pneumophila subsp. pascullei]AMP93895.1 hypothetical protein AXF36_15285 [Legionella pneumophila subsp. pascullei]AMP96812.1 hypothetical protein AXF37_14920 [Legionella pneumophila subsp. pascullei]SQG91869.1 Uncharacterized conserved protein [Legionella pneumophila subsp. pascullei]VEH08415.1 Uncharacterized conserved protein [Legionella pneumophila subsp. pa
MNFNIIGAGRLGKNLSIAMSVNQIASLNSICNSNLTSARVACNEIGFGNAVAKISELSEADITWITCRDDSITDVVSILDDVQILKKGSLVIHCSGALNSSVLLPLKKQGCYIASLHPLKAFRSNSLDSNAFKQVHCVIEGDSEACRWLKPAFEKLGASIIAIQPEMKAIYHAAATIASNYLVTLATYSEELLLQAGIQQPQSIKMLCDLMHSNIVNLSQADSIKSALTGPLARGDIQTISLHLEAIKNSEINRLYKTMALATLPLVDLSLDRKEILRKILEKE